jgi:hypothetical protein
LIKLAFVGVFLFGVAAFVLVDSGGVEFKKRTFGQTDLSERVSMVPVFHGYRLQAYLEQRIEAAQGWVNHMSQAIRKPA